MVERLRASNHTTGGDAAARLPSLGLVRGHRAGERFQVKRITVNPGGKLSLQKHFHRAEHWVVVNGTAEVTVDDESELLGENEIIYIPLGCDPPLSNPARCR